MNKKVSGQVARQEESKTFSILLIQFFMIYISVPFPLFFPFFFSSILLSLSRNPPSSNTDILCPPFFLTLSFTSFPPSFSVTFSLSLDSLLPLWLSLYLLILSFPPSLSLRSFSLSPCKYHNLPAVPLPSSKTRLSQPGPLQTPPAWWPRKYHVKQLAADSTLEVSTSPTTRRGLTFQCSDLRANCVILASSWRHLGKTVWKAAFGSIRDNFQD